LLLATYSVSLAQSVQFQLVLDPEKALLGKVNGITQEIDWVLLNLFNNAICATQQKKQRQDLPGIEDLASLPNGYQPEVTVSTKRVGDKVEIHVKDNGTGMPESVKSKIFQPFFTTKPTGQGTGLGLSLSYDIITKGHGGELKVECKGRRRR
jgi:signal transduction histidine kinase